LHNENELGGKKMNPSPTQVSKWRKVSEWRKEAKREWDENGYANWAHKDEFSNFFLGYLRARTEQATEITTLKAQIEELIPLAKFGAMVLGNRILMFQPSSVTSHALKAGVIISDNSIIQTVAYAPNIEATINKLLKD
jgi:hypothetical protein